MTLEKNRGREVVVRRKVVVMGIPLFLVALATVAGTNYILYQQIAGSSGELLIGAFVLVRGVQILFALALTITGGYLTLRATRKMNEQLTDTVNRLDQAQRIGKIGYWEFDFSTPSLRMFDLKLRKSV